MSGTSTQFLRFALVGVASNAAGFVLYLLLTGLGLGPKTAMTLLYVTGTAQTFFFNKRWSFRYAGGDRAVLLRYLVAVALGYLLNLSLLTILVDHAQLPHRLVQAGLIVLVAVFLFLLQKYWVFHQPQVPAPSWQNR